MKNHKTISFKNRKFIIPGDKEETIIFSAELFVKIANEAIEDHDAFFVALSGGSTPKAIFNLLATPLFSQKIDWSKVYLFWSDERSVPPDNPESNYKMAMDAAFSNIVIPSNQIFRMKGEGNLRVNAMEYEKIIKQLVPNESFDLVMLGMGEDGHTASLFPKTEALNIKNRLVVENEVPQLNTWRMTLTYDCINQARNTVIFVLGDSKAAIIKNIIDAKELGYPIEKIGTKKCPALWVLDENAAGGSFEADKQCQQIAF